jgi:hypothetical protein
MAPVQSKAAAKADAVEMKGLVANGPLDLSATQITVRISDETIASHAPGP